MTNVKPATDEEIATIRDYEVYHGDTQALIGRLVARHYADREENAGLKAYIASYKDGMKALRATDAAEIAALKAEVAKLNKRCNRGCGEYDCDRCYRGPDDEIPEAMRRVGRAR